MPSLYVWHMSSLLHALVLHGYLECESILNSFPLLCRPLSNSSLLIFYFESIMYGRLLNILILSFILNVL